MLEHLVELERAHTAHRETHDSGTWFTQACYHSAHTYMVHTQARQLACYMVHTDMTAGMLQVGAVGDRAFFGPISKLLLLAEAESYEEHAMRSSSRPSATAVVRDYGCVN